MPLSNYLKITVGDYQMQVSDPRELPVSIDYLLEDPSNFQSKKSSQGFDIEFPLILSNSVASNNFVNASMEDMTDGQIFKSSQVGVIEANGYELLVGKAFLKSSAHTDKPTKAIYNFLGNNGDWIVTLADTTLYDFIQTIEFSFTKQGIIDSWAFDGTNELLPYVFAPVRYRSPMSGYVINPVTNELDASDEDMPPEYMKPSISKYWIIYWAFKSIGYRVKSDFMDSEYFRKQVMPWTWGGFLSTESTLLDVHKFLAKSTGDIYFSAGRNSPIEGYVSLGVSNDSTLGGFDTNDDYHYDETTFEMIWEYKTPDFGQLVAAFALTLYYSASISGSASELFVWVDWFVNGVLSQTDLIVSADGNIVGTQRPVGNVEVFFKTPEPGVVVGDIVSAKVKLRLYRDKTAINDVCHIVLNVLEFKLDFFRIPIGGEINFANYTNFKNYKFLDFLAGVVDEFDLSIGTDSSSKVITIEPTHPYSLTSDPTIKIDGYFKNDFLNWNGKEDLKKEWILENFADHEKELNLKYTDDTNDGILKLIQDRNVCTVALGKYVFPDRFQKGSKDAENRFFSPTMHYFVTQWGGLGTGTNTGITPQMVCMIPENISNTSESASENVFKPKSCYYKGLVQGAGAWRFDGTVMQDYPFMFAVNYQDGGQDDPILSYSDELIGILTPVVGTGLLKRFFWQRLAIMRNGQRYNTWFKLKNIDVAGQLHREFKSYGGNLWELIQIKGYKPLTEESCSCYLYKWSPITQQDFLNTFPTQESVNGVITGSLDIKYSRLLCDSNDIPK